MSQIKSYVIGRGEDCDVRLSDASVSRNHAAVVVFADGRLHLTDHGTTNGTFVLADGAWRRFRQGFVDASVRLRFGRFEIAAERLRMLCPNGTRNSVVRDPETGEVIEQRSRPGRGGRASG